MKPKIYWQITYYIKHTDTYTIKYVKARTEFWAIRKSFKREIFGIIPMKDY